MDFNYIIPLILSIFGGFVVIGGGCAVLWRMVKPLLHIESRVSSLERETEELRREMKANTGRMKRIETFGKGMGTALVALLEHSKETSPDQCKEKVVNASIELQKILIER